MKESQSIEYKTSWRDDYLKWICGYANACGGTLCIGKDDSGKVVGCADAAKLLEEIPNKVRDVLGIMVDVNLHEEPAGDWLEIVVEPYPYPVSHRGQYHYRSGSTKQELKGAALDKFLLRRQGRHWDGVPVPHVTLKELDPAVLAQFRKQAARSKRLSPEILAEPDAALIDKLHLAEGGHVKRAAVLLFHPDPERFVTGAYVKIGYFENDAQLLYQDEVHGGLFTQVSETLGLLRTKYMKALISYEGVQRVETYPVPEEALREAVLNAIAHKDYSSGTPIQISVYADRLMLWNPGQLPPDWTVEQLKGKHSSQPFNPDIANAFFRAGMIEAWGLGIERLFAACKAAGLAVPELRCDGSGLWITFRYRQGVRNAMSVETPVSGKMSGKMSVETPVSGKMSGKMSVETPVSGKMSGKTRVKTHEAVLAALRANPDLTLTELAIRLERTPRTMERISTALVKAGRLRHIGPHNGGHWEVL